MVTQIGNSMFGNSLVYMLRAGFTFAGDYGPGAD